MDAGSASGAGRDQFQQIHLNSFDYIGVLKFNILGISHPRIAVVCSGGEWDRDNWVSLCGILQETIDAGIIQFGEKREEFLGFGKNLIAETNERQTAAIMSLCDLVLCVGKGYEYMAMAVEAPCVVVESDNFNCETNEITVAMVIDSIVRLCGNAKDAE